MLPAGLDLDLVVDVVGLWATLRDSYGFCHSFQPMGGYVGPPGLHIPGHDTL